MRHGTPIFQFLLQRSLTHLPYFEETSKPKQDNGQSPDLLYGGGTGDLLSKIAVQNACAQWPHTLLPDLQKLPMTLCTEHSKFLTLSSKTLISIWESKHSFAIQPSIFIEFWPYLALKNLSSFSVTRFRLKRLVHPCFSSPFFIWKGKAVPTYWNSAWHISQPSFLLFQALVLSHKPIARSAFPFLLLSVSESSWIQVENTRAFFFFDFPWGRG